MREFYIADDGIRLHAKLELPGGVERYPLVIVFHGYTGHMEERHILAVSEKIREAGAATLRVELYGHGQSEGDFENHTLFKWITNAMAVIDYAKTLDFVTELYVCGHSQGGLLTVIVAGMRPDEVKAIIPLAPALQIPEIARAGSWFQGHFDPEHIPEWFDTGERKLSGNYFRTAQLLHPEEAIQKYHGPVLIVHGDADEAVPVQYSIDAAKQYEYCELVIIPGDSHCYDYHLEQVTAAVGAFMARQMGGK